MASASDALRDAATFSKVFERAPLFLAISSLESGRFIALNDTFVHVTGYSRDEAVGRSALELGLWVDTSAERAGRERLERFGVVEETEVQLRMKNGEVRTFLISAETTDLDGRPCILNAAVDITERKRAEARLRFLSEASDILFVSLDVEVIVERIAQLAVPVWADWCAVSLREEDGSIRLAGVAHKDSEKVRWARDLRERYPALPDDPRGTARVIRTGEPEFYPEITDEMLTASARDPEHLRLLTEVPYRSVMIVPLKSRGRTLGALTLVRAETPVRYGADDLRFAQELAARAGMAIDNARLFEASERSQRQLATLNASLERLVAQRTFQVRQLAGELTLAEARERSRLAQVLHDDLQQQLYAVQFSLRDIQQRLADHDEARGMVEQTSELLREALAVSRATTADLSPPVLRGEGLVEALRWFGSEMRERYALEVAVEADESPAIPNEAVRALLFDLVRELLFNVTKHADTDRASVRLTEDEDGLSIVVADPGRGFDPALLDVEPAGKGTGLGLSGVRKRLQLFDGQLLVDSTPGGGTRITITMPSASLRLR